MQIRRASMADEATLWLIRRRSILELAAPIISSEEAIQWVETAAPDRIKRAIQEHDIWIAEDGINGVDAGWIEIAYNHIAGLYVDPIYARQGVGSMLLTIAEAAIKSAGYATVELGASQNALRFYLHHGYLQIGPQAADQSYPLKKNLCGIL